MIQISKFHKIKYNKKKKAKLIMNINKVNPAYNDIDLCETWLKGPEYCHLIGNNPGLLLASLLGITL